MSIERLVGAFVRRANRRILSFSESDDCAGLPPADPKSPYLLYLHIPYCMTLCPFCSFHRVRFQEDSAVDYFDCLRHEIDLVTDLGYRFDELYVGGGTPTVLPDALFRTLETIRDSHPLKEISVETNPDDLVKDSVMRLRDAGANRLSVGVQSFDDGLLREMQRYDRYGSGDVIRRRLEKTAGMFDTVNVDMIFNFPHQSELSLRRDLDILVDVGVDQVSFYPLMSVESTRRKMLETMGRVDPRREKRLYRMIAEHMLGAGYVRSSAWCFSRKPGMFDEYIVDRQEYVGLGSGAFSYVDGSLYASTFSLNHYRQLVRAGRLATTRHRPMSDRDQANYYLLMRLFGGTLDKASARGRFGGRLRWQLLALRAIRAIADAGDRFALTERGYYLWVLMMREFFTGVNALRDDMRHHIASERTALVSNS